MKHPLWHLFFVFGGIPIAIVYLLFMEYALTPICDWWEERERKKIWGDFNCRMKLPRDSE